MRTLIIPRTQLGLVIPATILLLLALLLFASPAEATLGNVVKIVYLHGAVERVSTWTFVASGILGLAYLLIKRPGLAVWAQAAGEVAMGFWIAQFLISLPAQVMAWGAIDWNEPRVNSAVWIIGLTAITYTVARWLDDRAWMSLASAANAVILIIILRGAINILHPFNPILGSDSTDIKLYYAFIILAIVGFSAWATSFRARQLSSPHPSLPS